MPRFGQPALRAEPKPPPTEGNWQPTLAATALTIVRYKRTRACSMKIRSVRHRGLKRFIEDNDGRGIRPDLVNRTRNILAALISAQNMDGVQGPPGWRIHQ